MIDQCFYMATEKAHNTCSCTPTFPSNLCAPGLPCNKNGNSSRLAVAVAVVVVVVIK